MELEAFSTLLNFGNNFIYFGFCVITIRLATGGRWRAIIIVDERGEGMDCNYEECLYIKWSGNF